MHEEVMSSETESWDGSSSTNSSSSSSSQQRVRKFTFREHEHGDSMGTMYLDLHPRPGKYTHAAHFTVRCGCLETPPDSPDPPVYQAPIIALVCNLSSASSGLSHSEVETLFHEFGHALHSLLSRTKFQHLSGTRAAMDFVETPSHLMEHFCWDAQFLKVLAVHPMTGEPLPDHMIHKLQASRHEFASLERQNQILYALFDQMLFGASTESLSTRDLFAKLHKDLSVPYADGTHWHSRFGHLVTYGAGYYGYLYSQVFAGDIWNECFQNDSFSGQAGHDYWHKLLTHGGAKDPTAMLTDLLGRPPKAHFFSQKV
jgi:intermediate peptidase